MCMSLLLRVYTTSPYIAGRRTASRLLSGGWRPGPSADVYLNIDSTVKQQRSYTSTTRSRTSLLRAINGTFPFRYTVTRKYLKILISNTNNGPLMNNLKIAIKNVCHTLIPTVDEIWHARREVPDKKPIFKELVVFPFPLYSFMFTPIAGLSLFGPQQK